MKFKLKKVLSKLKSEEKCTCGCQYVVRVKSTDSVQRVQTFRK